MTVRGGKNRVVVYVGAALLVMAVILFYHNAATRLQAATAKYQACHLNEESQSAQLQVLLEYKSRLEKSLQQEKSDHAQTKEDSKAKAEEERQQREKDNLESINKFTALQQQYKLLQSQHEDVTQELDKAKQELLTAETSRVNREDKIASLTRQMTLLQDDKQADITVMQSKVVKVEGELEALKLEKGRSVAELNKQRADLQRELAECLRSSRSALPPTQKKTDGGPDAEETLRAPVASQDVAPQRRSAAASSTAASRVEVVSGAAVYMNTSTPLINPDALNSQDGSPVRRGGADYNQVASPAAESIAEMPKIRAQRPGAAPPAGPAPFAPVPNEAANQVFNYDDHEMEHRKEEEDDDVDQLDYQSDNRGGERVGHAEAGPLPEMGVVPVAARHAPPMDGIMINPK